MYNGTMHIQKQARQCLTYRTILTGQPFVAAVFEALAFSTNTFAKIVTHTLKPTPNTLTGEQVAVLCP